MDWDSSSEIWWGLQLKKDMDIMPKEPTTHQSVMNQEKMLKMYYVCRKYSGINILCNVTQMKAMVKNIITY